jgi:hypothetical protein
MNRLEDQHHAGPETPAAASAIGRGCSDDEHLARVERKLPRAIRRGRHSDAVDGIDVAQNLWSLNRRPSSTRSDLMMELQVNGTRHRLDVPGEMPLVSADATLLGSPVRKFGCGIGAWGAGVN